MDDDLPILDEQPAIDLANTWYEHGDGVVDYLGDAPLARRWVAGVGGRDREDLVALRELRDAIRALLLEARAGKPLGRKAIAVVNHHASAACVQLELVVESGRAASRVRFEGAGALRARMATSCIEVLTGPDPVRRCEGPGCRMLFVQDHGRRRFCHDECSHRARQRRYRRSHT